jgi:hypothetical protein
MTVKKTFKDFMRRNYDDDRLVNIAQNGCVSGAASHLCYYTDTTKMYKKHKQEIWELLAKRADDLGEPVLTMIAGFNTASEISSVEHFENLLVWFSAETLAQQILDETARD